MPDRSHTPPAGDDWLQPAPEEQGLKRYIETIRERLWLIVLTTAIATVASVIYVINAEKVYEAEADILVTPVPSDSEIGVSLGLLRDTGDSLRTIETAARLIETPQVAAEAADQLGIEVDEPDELLDGFEAAPVAESNIVALVAQASTPEAAADLANAFGDAVIERRTRTLRAAIDDEIQRLRERGQTLANQGANAAGLAPINQEIAQLEALRAGPVPDMQFETSAIPPDSAVAPRPLLSVAGAMLAGLVIGLGAAFVLQAIDPRLRRESQLRSRYDVPVLARVPHEAGGGERPLTPEKLSADSIEAYRAVWGLMAASRPRSGEAPVALITSPSAGEGKTTTSINLAATLAMAGNSVILIEADLRLPDIGKTLGVRADRGLVSVLIDESPLEGSLATPAGFGSNLKVLLAEHSGPWLAELFSLPAAQRCIEEARSLADYVIIDSPPLTEVVDAMPLARAVDDIVVVTRLGGSRVGKIAELAELLAENRLRPAGFVVVGTGRSSARSYYHDYRRDLSQPQPHIEAVSAK